MEVTSASNGVKVALNADIANYSRLMADDFERTTATVEEYERIVAREVAANSGDLVSFVGDNFMAVFSEPTDAIKAAISTTVLIEKHSEALPDSERARFRMGLDMGEARMAGDKWFGDALNIASRVQALAPVGGVSVTDRIYQALDEPSLRFHPTGRKKLKGIPELVEVYEYSDLPGDGPAGHGTPDLALASPSVAVLPLHSADVPERLASVASMFRADLIHRLSQVPQLQVVDAAMDPAASARYMIELGVADLGTQARVYARVIDVSRMTGVKSHRWTSVVDRLAEQSDQMTEEVARSIEVDLIVGAPASLYAELDDPEAIEKIYLGWYHLTAATPEGWTEAKRLFGEVSTSHPDQPYGFVLSAFANWAGAHNEWASDLEEALRLAGEQAAIGLEKGDPTGMANAVQAAVLLSQGETDRAVDVVDKLHIERPTCDVTYGLEGSIRRYLGQWDKSVVSLDHAMRLTGMNKPWYPTVKACALYHGGRVEEAAATAEAVLDYQPNNLEALLVLAAAQRALGLERRAKATADQLRERFPAVDVETWIDSNPYQVEEIVSRWKEDLGAVGLIDH